jgi:vacuolar-type H+-ATPase subunit E/Vma4
MTLEKIVEEVLSHGQEEANRIHKEAGKQVLQILDKATREVESMMQNSQAIAEVEAKRIGTGQIAAANLEARKLLLKTKASTLQSVREGAMTRLKSLSIIEREKMIRKLLAKARKHIPEGTVYARAEDMDILKENIGSFRIGTPAKISGGIIVDSLDRKRRLDLSFETMFEETWERNFSTISHLLFKEEKE